VSVQVYFLITAVMLLFVSFVLIRGGPRRPVDDGAHEDFGQSKPSVKRASLVAELSARIFSPGDSEFVAGQCPNLARTFRQERTILAIEWLRGVRRQVNCLFRSHLKAARQNSDLTPAGELRLGAHFLTFQIATAVLYVVIRVQGPLRAARLVVLLLGLSDKFVRTAKEIIPIGSTEVAVELLELDPHANRRRAAQ
jgi:hypothetical protein